MVGQPSLDANSEIPLYRQLYLFFREEIESGRLPAGSRLPPTRELAGSISLNRTTVSAAYELLESEGWISSQVGRGTFVRAGARTSTGSIDWAEILSNDGGFEPPQPAGIDQEDWISFATSRPAARLFPLDAFRSCLDDVMRGGDFSGVLQLGSPAGYLPLRDWLLEEARQQEVVRESDDLLITSGCQQSLDLLARVLIRPGDAVVIEDPVYPGLRKLLTYYGARLTGVRMTESGIDLTELAQAALRERPRLIIVTPSFQNPTGATLASAHREAVLSIARGCQAVLVENEIYSGLRYSGVPADPIKKLDGSGDTVLLGSFSKVAFPGLRVGWTIAPRPLVARMTAAKQLADLHTDQLSQAVLLRFASTGQLAAHRARMLRAGSERLAATLEACGRCLPRGSSFTRPEGGMNVWVRLPEPLDAGELLPRVHRERIAYLPGRYFAVSRTEPAALRLSFAGLEPAQIERGIATLGRIFTQELARLTAQQSAGPLQAMV